MGKHWITERDDAMSELCVLWYETDKVGYGNALIFMAWLEERTGVKRTAGALYTRLITWRNLMPKYAGVSINALIKDMYRLKQLEAAARREPEDDGGPSTHAPGYTHADWQYGE